MQSLSADKTFIHFSTCLFIVPHNNLTDSPSAFSFPFLHEFLNASFQALTATSLSVAATSVCHLPHWLRSISVAHIPCGGGRGSGQEGFPVQHPHSSSSDHPSMSSSPFRNQKGVKNRLHSMSSWGRCYVQSVVQTKE